jgi:ligand-binding SRPBCC domain-containing protein
MKYRHIFKVNAPVQVVSDFHTRSTSMGAITPPPVLVRVHHAPEILGEGDQMDFTLWVGPLPIRWLAVIEGCSPRGFMDRQLSGPFAVWLHRHHFFPVGKDQTEVIDEVTFSIKKHPIWGIVGLGMGVSLPFLFAYRAWKTRRLINVQGRLATQKTPRTGK